MAISSCAANVDPNAAEILESLINDYAKPRVNIYRLADDIDDLFKSICAGRTVGDIELEKFLGMVVECERREIGSSFFDGCCAREFTVSTNTDILVKYVAGDPDAAAGFAGQAGYRY